MKNIFYLQLLIAIISLIGVFSDDEVPERSEGSTDAHFYAKGNDFEGLIDLADENKNLLFAADANGWTPLHEAARNQDVLVVNFLVENGADPLAKNSNGDSPRDVLNKEILHEEDEFLRAAYLLVDVILKLAEKGRGLDDHVIDREALNSDPHVIEDTPGLANALVSYGLLDTLESLFLVNDDAIYEADRNGWTPLHEAARTGNLDIISFLIEQGANAHEETNDGRSVMNIAKGYAKKTGSDIVEILSILDTVHEDDEDDDEDEAEEEELIPTLNVDENDIEHEDDDDDDKEDGDEHDDGVDVNDSNEL